MRRTLRATCGARAPPQFDLDGDGKVDASDAQIALKKFTEYMTDTNSAVTGSTFAAGLVYGLRRG